ncbi:hypothetical protein [Methylobacterium sp. 275MFSha3.1]|uniref:hypothetical protein n=1 Tax=Methylobacterium sp. 275MFSha3.1 TaxID=1502746 RepID=UPI00147A32DA|nr:hypothetical protein [Methylobacterium sp. 275MFSha3.1]
MSETGVVNASSNSKAGTANIMIGTPARRVDRTVRSILVLAAPHGCRALQQYRFDIQDRPDSVAYPVSIAYVAVKLLQQKSLSTTAHYLKRWRPAERPYDFCDVCQVSKIE